MALPKILIKAPRLYTKQRAALFTPLDSTGQLARYSWIEGSTKSGKTAGCMAWLLDQALTNGKEGREFWWVAPISTVAAIAFKRFKRKLHKLMVRKIISAKGDEHIVLANGAILRFKSAENPDSLYGEDVWAAVLDEASRMKVDAFYAIRSTLTATRGPIRIIGNVKGRKNWFYIGSRKAEAGEKGHSYHKLTALDAVEAGVFPQEELDDARRALPEAIFNELYLCIPTDDGGNPFGLKYIKQNIAPISKRAPVAFGVDLAKSVDCTVIHGLDENGATAVHERFQMPWAETTTRARLICGTVATSMDSTGVGDPIVEGLQKTNPNITGYKFTQASKQMLMEGLALAIQNGRVSYPDGVIVSELESFEYEYTRTGVKYTAPEGCHDDCVMALALAVHRMNNREP